MSLATDDTGMNQELVGQDIRVDAPGSVLVRVVVEAALAFLEAAGVDDPSSEAIERCVLELVGDQSAQNLRGSARLILAERGLEMLLENGSGSPRSVTCSL